MIYLVNNCYNCVQGEGSLTGTAMVLLRLQGCEVGCTFCDTKETWLVDEQDRVSAISDAAGTNSKYVGMSEQEITGLILHNHRGPKWVLVTGGEPALQNLKPLVYSLHLAGYKVAIETSGTAPGFFGAHIDWVCVSPKIENPGSKPVLPEAIALADELKFIIGKESDIARVDNFLANYSVKDEVLVCLQPVSLSYNATNLCLKTVQERGWRLSVQMHKYLNLP